MTFKNTRPPRSDCPIARTLEIVGDKWTLIIIRDMITGKSRFGEFLTSPEKITTNVLTDRLELLERTGLVTRTAYQKRPLRHEYHLTKMGKGLLPVLQDISRWGNQFIPGTWIPPEKFMQMRVE